MYRLFKLVLDVRPASLVGASVMANAVAVSLKRPARFFSSVLPMPSVIERELRAVVKEHAAERERIKFIDVYRQLQDCRPHETKVPLTTRANLAIDLIIERIRDKYGIRELNINDSWETIAIVTYPEKWISDAVQEKGKSLEEALVFTVRQMVPKVRCLNLEDLVEIISINPPDPSKTNQHCNAVVEEIGAEKDHSMKPN